MRRSRYVRGPFRCAALLLALSGAASAQEGYEIEVYPSATVAPRTLSLEVHSNFTFDGQRLTVDGVAPTNRADHETLEATLGVTSWSEVAAYVFTSEQSGLGAQYAGGSGRARVRIPEAWAWPVGLSLSTEVEYARPLFSEETWSWEIRPIADRYFGRWYFAVNPTVERTWAGTSMSRGVQFSPSAKGTYDFTQIVSAGLEYYAAAGEPNGLVIGSGIDTVTAPSTPPNTHLDRIGPGLAIGGPSRLVDNDEVLHIPHGERQQVFAVIDLHVSPLWEINAGVGVGTTSSTDRLVAKLIVGRNLSWGAPPPPAQH